MKPFGFLLLGYIFNIFISKKSLKEKYIQLISLLVVLELFINAGYMFKIGSYELLYTEFVLIIVILFSVFFFITKKIKLKMAISAHMLFMSLAITEMLLTINPLREMILRNNEYVIPQISIYSLLIALRMVIFIIVALALKTLLVREYFQRIIGYIYKYGTLMLYILFIEWITKNIFKSDIFIDAVTIIFGQGEFMVDIILNRGGLSSLQGFMREPAHLVIGIFYSATLIILSNLEIKNINKFLMLALPLLSLSGSFSAILYIGCIFIIYNTKRRITPDRVLIFISILTIILPFIISTEIFQYYYLRFINSYQFLRTSESSLVATSEGYRINSIIETLKIWRKRPLFGIGLSIPYSYGFLSVFFASVGICGFVMWYIFIFKVFGEVRLKHTNIFIFIALFIAWFFSGSIGEAYSIVTLLIIYEVGEFSKSYINLKKQ